MINGGKFFDQPANNKERTYDNIQKLTNGRGVYYTTGFPLDYHCFKHNYQTKMIDSSKQQTLDRDPKAIQKINFNESLKVNVNITFNLEEIKLFLIFPKSIVNLFHCNLKSR